MNSARVGAPGGQLRLVEIRTVARRAARRSARVSAKSGCWYAN